MVHIPSSSTNEVKEMQRFPTEVEKLWIKTSEQFTHLQQEAWRSSCESSPSPIHIARDLVEGTSVEDVVAGSTGRQIMEVDVAVLE